MIVRQQDLDKYFYEIKFFCREAMNDCKNTQTRMNMDSITWKFNPASLLHCLYKQKKIDPLFLAYENDKLIGLAGIEKYNEHVAIISKRLFVLREYRNKLIHWKQILKPQVEWCRNQGFKVCIATQNEYKKVMHKHIRRWDKGFIFLPGKYNICGCEQYICGLYLDEKYKEKTIKQWMELYSQQTIK